MGRYRRFIRLTIEQLEHALASIEVDHATGCWLSTEKHPELGSIQGTCPVNPRCLHPLHKRCADSSLDARLRRIVKNYGHKSKCWTPKRKQIDIEGVSVTTRYAVYEQATGQQISAGVRIQTMCGTRGCANPKHLQLVSTTEPGVPKK